MLNAVGLKPRRRHGFRGNSDCRGLRRTGARVWPASGVARERLRRRGRNAAGAAYCTGGEVSCPNLEGRARCSPATRRQLRRPSRIRRVRRAGVAKLTPNVTDLSDAEAALGAGAEALTLINTVFGIRSNPRPPAHARNGAAAVGPASTRGCGRSMTCVRGSAMCRSWASWGGARRARVELMAAAPARPGRTGIVLGDPRAARNVLKSCSWCERQAWQRCRIDRRGHQPGTAVARHRSRDSSAGARVIRRSSRTASRLSGARRGTTGLASTWGTGFAMDSWSAFGDDFGVMKSVWGFHREGPSFIPSSCGGSRSFGPKLHDIPNSVERARPAAGEAGHSGCSALHHQGGTTCAAGSRTVYGAAAARPIHRVALQAASSRWRSGHRTHFRREAHLRCWWAAPRWPSKPAARRVCAAPDLGRSRRRPGDAPRRAGSVPQGGAVRSAPCRHTRCSALPQEPTCSSSAGASWGPDRSCDGSIVAEVAAELGRRRG